MHYSFNKDKMKEIIKRFPVKFLMHDTNLHKLGKFYVLKIMTYCIVHILISREFQTENTLLNIFFFRTKWTKEKINCRECINERGKIYIYSCEIKLHHPILFWVLFFVEEKERCESIGNNAYFYLYLYFS